MQEKDISKADFEQCQKCSICLSVCPMHEVNPLYPGPKQAGPDWERYRMKNKEYFDYSLKYCLGCRRCETACPSGVKIADLIVRAKLELGSGAASRLASPVKSLRDMTLASTDSMGSIASVLAPIANPILASKPAKAALSLAGIHSKRTFPKYSAQKFEDWFNSSEAPSQEGFGHYITYFHGCYVGYNYPSLGKDTVALLNACGVGVRLLKGEKCCGVALLSNGFGTRAGKNARHNVLKMREALLFGSEAVLTSSSSCTLMMREEYPHLLDVDNSAIREKLQLVTRYLYERVSSGQIRLAFKEGLKGSIAYHTACHMQRLGWQPYSIGLLKMIPGLDLKVLEQQCCGIAGTFGFKKENYAFTQAIGSKLFDSIRQSGAGAVATDCETCKWQIEMSTGLKVYNPIEILANAMDLEETARLNAKP